MIIFSNRKPGSLKFLDKETQLSITKHFGFQSKIYDTHQIDKYKENGVKT